MFRTFVLEMNHEAQLNTEYIFFKLSPKLAEAKVWILKID